MSNDTARMVRNTSSASGSTSSSPANTAAGPATALYSDHALRMVPMLPANQPLKRPKRLPASKLVRFI